MIIPNICKNKKVSNHQPVCIYIYTFNYIYIYIHGIISSDQILHMSIILVVSWSLPQTWGCMALPVEFPKHGHGTMGETARKRVAPSTPGYHFTKRRSYKASPKSFDCISSIHRYLWIIIGFTIFVKMKPVLNCSWTRVAKPDFGQPIHKR